MKTETNLLAPLENPCLYDVLGLHRKCTAGDIWSAYRKLALQRHPDKLIKSGFSESEATKSFQELVNAYEVLSDAKERAWYDSHRLQILFSSENIINSSPVLNLFRFFSNSVYLGYSDIGKGFYNVYSNVFDIIYLNEVNYSKKLGLVDVVKGAPKIGNLDSPYEQVIAFYGYWLGFSTVIDFVWMDKYDVATGLNKRFRRFMEEENKKMRRKGRREYHETVRRLAEFVQKRDKRVIDFQMKKNADMKRKKEETRAARRAMEREIEEPRWEKVKDFDVEDKMEKRELYCVVCFKKFKSEIQWKNHERSKKHKENSEALWEVLTCEDEFVLVDEVYEEVDRPKSQLVGEKVEEENKDYYEKLVNIYNDGSIKMSTASKKDYIETENEQVDSMESNNKKREKERDKTSEEEEEKQGVHRLAEQVKTCGDADKLSSSLSSSKVHANDGQRQNVPLGRINASRQSRVEKLAHKKEVEAILKLAHTRRKQKGTRKDFRHVCDTCGEDFESRNKLHRHLNDTDHAALKNRRTLYHLQKKYGSVD